MSASTADSMGRALEGFATRPGTHPQPIESPTCME